MEDVIRYRKRNYNLKHWNAAAIYLHNWTSSEAITFDLDILNKLWSDLKTRSEIYPDAQEIEWDGIRYFYCSGTLSATTDEKIRKYRIKKSKTFITDKGLILIQRKILNREGIVIISPLVDEWDDYSKMREFFECGKAGLVARTFSDDHELAKVFLKEFYMEA